MSCRRYASDSSKTHRSFRSFCLSIKRPPSNVRRVFAQSSGDTVSLSAEPKSPGDQLVPSMNCRPRANSRASTNKFCISKTIDFDGTRTKVFIVAVRVQHLRVESNVGAKSKVAINTGSDAKQICRRHPSVPTHACFFRNDNEDGFGLRYRMFHREAGCVF